MINPEEAVRNFRAFAALDREARVMNLRALPAVPTAHPVFEKVAEKLGRLSYEVALDVSKSNNAVTSVRLILSSMKTEEFISAPDGLQQQRLKLIANIIEKHAPDGVQLIVRLKRTADQGFLSFLLFPMLLA